MAVVVQLPTSMSHPRMAVTPTTVVGMRPLGSPTPLRVDDRVEMGAEGANRVHKRLSKTNTILLTSLYFHSTQQKKLLIWVQYRGGYKCVYYYCIVVDVKLLTKEFQ